MVGLGGSSAVRSSPSPGSGWAMAKTRGLRLGRDPGGGTDELCLLSWEGAGWGGGPGEEGPSGRG